jgi:hypothetical protein
MCDYCLNKRSAADDVRWKRRCINRNDLLICTFLCHRSHLETSVGNSGYYLARCYMPQALVSSHCASSLHLFPNPHHQRLILLGEKLCPPCIAIMFAFSNLGIGGLPAIFTSKFSVINLMSAKKDGCNH